MFGSIGFIEPIYALSLNLAFRGGSARSESEDPDEELEGAGEAGESEPEAEFEDDEECADPVNEEPVAMDGAKPRGPDEQSVS